MIWQQHLGVALIAAILHWPAPADASTSNPYDSISGALVADGEAFRSFANFLTTTSQDNRDQALEILCVQMNFRPNLKPGHAEHPVVPSRDQVDETECGQWLDAIVAAHQRLREQDIKTAERTLCAETNRPQGDAVAVAFDDLDDLLRGNSRRELNVVLRHMSAEDQDRFLSLVRHLKKGMHGYELRGSARLDVWAESGDVPDVLLEQYCSGLRNPVDEGGGL